MSYKSEFAEKGYALIDNVFNDEEIAEMKEAMKKIVDDFDFDNLPKSIFATYDENKHAKDEYFVESGAEVRGFFEEGALNKEGEVIVEKQFALNKVGHALHWLNPVFKKYSFHAKLKEIMRTLDFEVPQIVQSMYIFKQPRIGGLVNEHIDATFLRANPIGKLVGLWIALDDATEENGCLHFVPGSHKTTTADYSFVRTYTKDGPIVQFRGPKPDYTGLPFLTVPVKKGSLVLIHGLCVHKSDSNTSDKTRHAYTMHILESKGAEWLKENWLQPTSTYSFPNMFDH
ncbi:hypothetical protein PENTCL1PPCAC_17362 [Pristionchus entomophagus]|uniref:Phytanoyl-CoA dioxygenase n=1 Tax=Pristionchus entomophagus TaxID=358040 RepID=A0AAV5TLF0_9BILA|nr:hypothetical protein PENTCL1PPCAC_17362 [Pristionchus entomophagus]